MIEQRLSPIIIELEPYSGEYVSESLSVIINSLGYGCGYEVVWKWLSGSVDIGLVGVYPGRDVGLNVVCNSQPWYGSAALLQYQLADHRQVEGQFLLTFQHL